MGGWVAEIQAALAGGARAVAPEISSLSRSRMRSRLRVESGGLACLCHPAWEGLQTAQVPSSKRAASRMQATIEPSYFLRE